MKKIALAGVLILLLTGCSNSRSAEDLESLVNLAKTTGAIQGLSHNSAYGVKSIWCKNLADQYISSVMGFDGSNGDEDMGTVSVAYFRACMGF
jgi:hypothetical protein